MSSTPDGDPLDLQIDEGWGDEPNDWNRVITGSSAFSTSYDNSGDGGSLRVDRCNSNESLTLYSASDGDNPSQVKIVTDHGTFNSTGESADLAFYIHYQNSNNFLVFSWNGRNEVQLNEKNSGSWSVVAEYNNVSYDTSTGSWERVTFDAWYDSSGTLNTRLLDPSGNIVGSSLIHSNPPWSSGGVGVGASYQQSSLGCNGHLYVDNTEVHYPDSVSAPSTPQNFSATPDGNDPNLNWNPVNWNGDVGHYEILRGPVGGSLSQIDTTSNTSYNDASASQDSQYDYAVRSQNSAGTSGTSNRDSAVTLPNSPTLDSLSFIS